MISDKLRLWRNTYSAPVEMRSEEPPDDLAIFLPLSGCLNSPTKEEHNATQSDMLCSYPSLSSNWLISQDTTVEGVAIPRHLLQERLRVLLGSLPKQELQFKVKLESRGSAAQAVRSVIQALLAATEQSDINVEGGAVRGLSCALIDLVLEVLPNSYTDRLRRPAPQVCPRQVRRALDYIEGNPRPTLLINDLAAICNVGARSLHYTFLDFVGMTPGEYWRQVRVKHALDDLRANPSVSVSDVARVWGFTNVTRFRSLCIASGAGAIVGQRRS